MTNRPAYLRPLLAHIREMGLRPGTITHVEILHDDDCGFWSGKPCDCEPEILSGPGITEKYGGNASE